MAHIALTKRLVKGSPLTPGEGDANSTAIENAVNGLMDRADVTTNADGSLKNELVTKANTKLEVLGRGYFVDSSVAANTIEITISPTPTLAALLGTPLRIRVANTISGATQLKVKGDAGVTVATLALRHYGNVEMAANEVQQNQIICAVYDGTIFQFQSAVAPATITEKTKTGFVNLRIRNKAGAAGDAQLDVTADEIVVRNAAGGYATVRNIVKVLDMGVQGPGGRESALAESASTWYFGYFLVSADLQSTTVVFSNNDATPNLANVTGYTNGYYCLIGAFFNDGSSNIFRFFQHDQLVTFKPIKVINARANNGFVYTKLADGSPAGTTELTFFRTGVPTIATYVRGTAGMDATTPTSGGSGLIQIARAADDPATGDDNQIGESSSGGGIINTPEWSNAAQFEVPVNARNIAVKMWDNSGGAEKYRLDITGFRW